MRWDKVKVVLDAMEVVANLRWLLKISRFSPFLRRRRFGAEGGIFEFVRTLPERDKVGLYNQIR